MPATQRIYYQDMDGQIEYMNLTITGQYVNSEILLAYESNQTPRQILWAVDIKDRIIKELEISDIMPSYQRLKQKIEAIKGTQNALVFTHSNGLKFYIEYPKIDKLEDSIIYRRMDHENTLSSTKQLSLLDHLLDRIKGAGFSSLDPWERKKLDYLSKNIKEEV